MRFISPAVRADQRALTVEAVVPNPDGALKPGLFATARPRAAGRAGAAARRYARRSRGRQDLPRLRGQRRPARGADRHARAAKRRPRGGRQRARAPTCGRSPCPARPRLPEGARVAASADAGGPACRIPLTRRSPGSLARTETLAAWSRVSAPESHMQWLAQI